ncbi:radical SAM P-methyltransferase, PhpK family [Clostridium cavendishii DSM 21758]|uniref:Radical SAM P-methyltransferase, PhpK family n=1 Tax=Clostridium cavendishii DSM 21758 TaxID=1121302 RepID=A0A1M6MSA2_9CLOT|nr:radical SAM protein [Clostridium cavendishii]SHJ86351.1 radical SAM P-methyltransferase, PhpK family [Clostridium cavendishii DSM 21758]
MKKVIDCLLIGYRTDENYSYYQDFANKFLDGQVVEKQFNGTISYLGTFLHRRGYSFDYINYMEDEYDLLSEKLKNNSYMTICLSTTYIMKMQTLVKLIKIIRMIKPDSKIVLGGPYIVNLLREKIIDKLVKNKLLKMINADVIINDFQGEATLCNILTAIREGECYESIPNLCYRMDNNYHYTHIIREDNKLEHNTVDWRLFADRIRSTVSIRTSQSCPFSCKFCNFHVIEGKYSYISVEAIERELNTLKSINKVKCINFVDDTFNMPKERFRDILKMMIKNNYQFKWYSYIRCQFLDEEIVSLMKESKCLGVYLGIESGNQEMLNNMNKRADVSDFYRAIALLNKYGIVTYGTFFVGFPGETEDSVQDTIRFLNESGITFYDIYQWRYDINTPISQEKEKYGLEGCDYEWKHNTMDSIKAREMCNKIVESVMNSTRSQFDPTMFFLLLAIGCNIDMFTKYYNRSIQDFKRLTI